MPTVLMISGWRLFFYANELNEPIHIHCRKGDSETKYWLDPDKFEIIEAYSYKMTVSETGNIRRIIYAHFDYIVSEWLRFQERKYE